MTESISYNIPLLSTNAKQKMLTIEENKIKTLENRLMGPNSEGKYPSEYIPLKDGEIENIKTKILLNEPSVNVHEDSSHSNDLSKKCSNKSSNNINSNNNLSKKKFANKNMCDYLMNKRMRDNSISQSINEYLINNNNQETTANINNNSFQELFSSKHCIIQNNLFISKSKEKVKNKNISDYYHKTNNTPSIATKLSFNSSAKENLTSNNELSLLSELKEKNKLLQEKEKEIERLSKINNENELIISELNDYKSSYEMEIKKCRYDISNFVKENEHYKRQLKQRKIHEQQLRLGKFTFERISKGIVIDIWEDGNELSSIKRRLDEIRIEKEELEKQKKKIYSNKSRSTISNNNIIINNFETEYFEQQDQKDLLMFKYNKILREENDLKEQKEKLDIEKHILIHDINLFKQEQKCTFANMKEGWPLIAGRYQIVGLLGKGGYSEVYKAYDLENHCDVACKLHQLNQNWSAEIKDNYIKHTIRENQIHQQINHPKIVKHYDTIEIDNNSFCTILEYCTGPDLAAYLKQNKNISEKEARIIITQILLGLEYLNKLDKKIIHYDLKPENIIFHNMEIKISDFGLSKIMEHNQDQIQLTSQGAGTYWYLPPECFEEKYGVNISSKVDIFSIGVILYEMFYRKKPFGENVSQEIIFKEKVMSNAKKVEFPVKPTVSEECKDFIKHCLAFRESDRYDVFQALNSSFIKHDKRKGNNNNKE